MKAFRYGSTTAVAAVFATAALPASAVVITSPGGGHAVAQLAYDAHVHTEAFRKALLVSDKLVPVKEEIKSIRDSPMFLRKLRTRVHSSTLSLFDYTPKGANLAPLRVHARSGKSIEATLNDIVRVISPGQSGGSTSEAGERVSDNEVLADASDARFYPASTDIRATNLQKKDLWVVEPSPEAHGDNVGRIIHGTDAELKTLRQLEYEFDRNPALYRNGGDLVGYVSQEVCHSCTAAFDAFSERYNVDIRVHYLRTPVATSPQAEEFHEDAGDVMSADLDVASKGGAAFLRRFRKNSSRTMLSSAGFAADGEAAWPAGPIIELVGAAETGDLGLPPACRGE